MLKDPIPKRSVLLKNGLTASVGDCAKELSLMLLLFRVLILRGSLGGITGGGGSIVKGDWGPLLLDG